VSLVLYPDLTNSREGFVLVMRDVLPAGLLGLLFAAFLAAFTSTFAAHLNWGTSYLINDFWRRFIKTDGDERYYVRTGRIVTALLAVVAFFVTTQLQTIAQAWELVLTASAGLGLVLILRWYWWRVNAWSELAATLAPIVMVLLTLLGVPIPGMQATFPNNLFAVVAITTVIWLAVTFMTRPTSDATLDRYFRRVRPGGPGWKPVIERNPDVQPDSGLGALAIQWLVGITLVYSTLFGFGNVILGDTLPGLMLIGVAVAAGAFLWWDIDRRPVAIVDQPDDIPHQPQQ
jgi:solute:Na+ symporter, SSS family